MLSVKTPSSRLYGTLLVLFALILIQVFYLREHADWALSHPIKGAHWLALASHGTEHPSDFLPGGYFTQNRNAILLFLLVAALLIWPLKRLQLLRHGRVVLLTVICLLTFFALAILISAQHYYWGILDRRSETAQLVELIRLPMTQVPRGHCEERTGLRLQAPSAIWLMHLKCDTGLAYAIQQNPPRLGTRFHMESGRDDRGNRVLLALQPLAEAQR